MPVAQSGQQLRAALPSHGAPGWPAEVARHPKHNSGGHNHGPGTAKVLALEQLLAHLLPRTHTAPSGPETVFMLLDEVSGVEPERRGST